jgi:hypothetical protein
MSDTRDLQLPASFLSALIAILDIVVLERVAGGAFTLPGKEPPPSWFAEAFNDVDPSGPVTLLEAFPVLDSFLSEAEVFWRRTAYGRLDGEAFVVGGPGGRNLPLTTMAVALEGRQFLLIQRVAGFDDRQHILQRAREQGLAHEQVVNRIEALRRPFKRLTGLAGELEATSGLSESQRTLLTAVSSELDTLRQLLDHLPKLPPGTSARRR